MDEFKEIVFGTLTFGSLAAYALLGLMGAIVNLWMEVQERNKQSMRSPSRFSISFLAWDNLKRIIATVIGIFIFIRFFQDITGYPLNALAAVVTGFNVDRFMQFLKKGMKVLKSKGEKMYETDH